MTVEVMRPQISTWGLWMQKPTSTSSRSVDPNPPGDVPPNAIQRTPLGPQWLCLMSGETRFSRDRMVLPFLKPQKSRESDPPLCPKRSLPLKNPETRRSSYRVIGKFTDGNWNSAHRSIITSHPHCVPSTSRDRKNDVRNPRTSTRRMTRPNRRSVRSTTTTTT